MKLNDFQLTEHFNLAEFQCPCCLTVKVSPQLVLMLEAVRKRWGKPLIVNSGFRCEPHNKEVGGVKFSLHRQGRAADIRAAASEQDSLSSIAAEAGFAKAIMYKERGFIHLETGGNC